jgi:hypothetical protein
MDEIGRGQQEFHRILIPSRPATRQCDIGSVVSWLSRPSPSGGVTSVIAFVCH